MFSFLLATTQQWESHEYRRKFLFNQNFNQIQPLCQPFPQFPQQQYEQFPQQHEGQYQQLLQEFPLQPPNEQPTHQVEQYQPFLQPQRKQSQQLQELPLQQQQNELGIPILTLDSLNQLLQPNGNITEEQQQDFNLDDFLETITSPNPIPQSMLI